MKKLTWVVLGCLGLIGCSSSQTEKMALKLNHGVATKVAAYDVKHGPKADARKISFYTHPSQIQRPYRIIGKETISKYNFIGLERHPKTVNNIMASLAASIGGDAIVNITYDNQKIEGTVISYEKPIVEIETA